MSESYNYECFPKDLDAPAFRAFATAAPVGEPAPTGELIDATTGDTVTLASLWKKGPLILEFGSIT
jgi:hypothetical protein